MKLYNYNRLPASLRWRRLLPDQEAAERHPGIERESWRLRVTNHLASAMLLARNSESSELPPWRFAMERLRLEGIETETWTAAHSLAWAESASGESYGAN